MPENTFLLATSDATLNDEQDYCCKTLHKPPWVTSSRDLLHLAYLESSEITKKTHTGDFQTGWSGHDWPESTDCDDSMKMSNQLELSLDSGNDFMLQ